MNASRYFVAFLVIGSLALLGLGPSCTAPQKAAGRTALEVAKSACVIVPVAFDDPAVKQVCATTEALSPILSQLLQAKRRLGASGVTDAQVCIAPPPDDGIVPVPEQ